jgi:hypothetical protein
MAPPAPAAPHVVVPAVLHGLFDFSIVSGAVA